MSNFHRACCAFNSLFNSIAIHDENPIGKIVMFNKRPLRIIGVVFDKQMGGASSSLNLYAPYTTVMNRISGRQKNWNAITVKVDEFGEYDCR